MMNNEDIKYLERCVELAEEALGAGDAPFGSILVSGDGEILKEDRNRDMSVDVTQHPEFNLARWAAQNMTEAERKKATVYTSGEHCPMCSAAHGLAGLGRIVYASSSEQMGEWLLEMNIPRKGSIRSFPIQAVIPGATVEGPVSEVAEKVRTLQYRYHGRSQGK